MKENVKTKYIVVIPARMQSSRLPGKPLIDLEGKSLIERTWLQCCQAVDRSLIYVATDHEDIRQHCEARGMQVVMTSSTCLTGTDRLAEVAQQLDAKVYLNVQGDEPLINPQDILDTIAAIESFPGEVINGYAGIQEEAQYRSLTIPKVVFRPDGRLLYMSRSPIPGNKSGVFNRSWRQICVYAFPKQALHDFAATGKKTPLEEEEDLEILRFLELDYEVRMIPLSADSVAVDTLADAEKVRTIIKGMK
ncbi:MAG: 3-deoxy-manno-octulosonate cytidylyltransferase [Cyclobacteriaceae bacterium]|nr:3-deoxy-manno-octulosonate cytidylyltransferase [Cyclobacteriaceae bacterium]MCH8516925.1 3-deoxy-manno-octulosonate cytidylyltransferase [Cyclobacteriaceae bacterium]